jgi:hypothetical protein
MKKLVWYALLFFGWQRVFAQEMDSSRIEFFFRGGSDLTKEIMTNPTPDTRLSESFQSRLKPYIFEDHSYKEHLNRFTFHVLLYLLIPPLFGFHCQMGIAPIG